MTSSKLSDRHLYLCTPDRDDLEWFVAECIRGGVDVVQLRDKHLDAKGLLRAGTRCKEVCDDLGVPFILNDRPDLALEIGASGVHVGQDDAPVSLCRQILGPDAIIGLSTHEEAELEESLGQAVTYISAGPVEETPTKPGRAGTGIEYAAHAVETSPRPVFVTGGVTPASIPKLSEHGITHFVVVRNLTEASSPFDAARSLADAIRRSLGR
jgi:thiamine-phosphate pyrophosphorylase